MGYSTDTAENIRYSAYRAIVGVHKTIGRIFAELLKRHVDISTVSRKPPDRKRTRSTPKGAKYGLDRYSTSFRGSLAFDPIIIIKNLHDLIHPAVPAVKVRIRLVGDIHAHASIGGPFHV